MIRFLNVIGLVLVFISQSVSVWSQVISPPSLKEIHCPPIEMLVSVERVVNGVAYSGIDSTLLRKEVDSIYTHLKGNWSLFQVQGGWGRPKLPNGKINLVIDELGNAVISEQDKELISFQFKLRRDWQAIYSPLEAQSQSFFMKMIRGLIIELCQDTLVLNEARGDGREYVFKRLTSIQTSK
jgi:hypothetical protein